MLSCILILGLLGMNNYSLKMLIVSHKEQNPKGYIGAMLLFSHSWNDFMLPYAIRGLRWLKDPSTIGLQKRAIHSSKFYDCPFQCSESLFYFLLIPWCRRWLAKPSSLGYQWLEEKQLLNHWFRLCLFYDSPIAQWEVNTFFFSSQLLLFVLRLGRHSSCFIGHFRAVSASCEGFWSASHSIRWWLPAPCWGWKW